MADYLTGKSSQFTGQDSRILRESARINNALAPKPEELFENKLDSIDDIKLTNRIEQLRGDLNLATDDFNRQQYMAALVRLKIIAAKANDIYDTLLNQLK